MGGKRETVAGEQDVMKERGQVRNESKKEEKKKRNGEEGGLK